METLHQLNPDAAPEPTQAAAQPGKRKRTGRRARPQAPQAERLTDQVKQQAQASWQRIQGELAVRLARLNPGKLKEVLLACGIAAGVALVIVALAKLLPVVLVLFAVVGLSITWQIWEQVRPQRLPI